MKVLATFAIAINLINTMSKPLGGLIKQVQKMEAAVDRLDRTMAGLGGMQSLVQNNLKVVQVTQTINNNYQQINNTLTQTASSYQQINNSLTQTNNTLGQTAAQQENVNAVVKQGQGVVGLLDKGLKGLISKYASIQSLQDGMKLSDDYMNSLTRIEAINDKLQSPEQLQSKIFAASDRSRGSYSDMLGMVGKLGATGAFKSNDEEIAFAETMQKSFRLGGTSMADQKSGMDQVAGAMSEGKLSGDGFKSILEKAPMIAAAISQFTGKSESQLEKMAEKGGLTANILKNSLFAASGDISSKFGEMPLSFADYMAQMRSTALQSFGPVIQQISQLINSPAGGQFLQGFGAAISIAAQLAGQLFTAVSAVVGFMSDNMPIIEPIIWGLVTAMTGLWLITKWQAITQVFQAVASGISTAALFIQMVAVFGLREAWSTLNATMKTNIFIVIISVVVGLIVWLIHLWQTNDQFAAALMGVWNAILNFFDQIPGFFWGMVEAMLAPYVWLAQKIGFIYDNVINGIIDGINHVLQIVNKVTGSSFEIQGHFSMENLTKGIQSFAADQKKNAFANAADQAAKRQNRTDDIIKAREEDRLKKEKEKNANPLGKGDYRNLVSGTYSNPPGTVPVIGAGAGTIPKIGEVGEVGKINNTVDISSEDIEMMRNIAEMNAIQNFVTLTPTVQVTTGPISKDVDVDEVIRRIGSTMEQEIQSSAQGAYG
ncbi:tape measure protein [Paenibacillus sp. BK720]|uniref:tape measure protein n=1 Tax=Paenibacillus sp. BK720 TaxID=2587092 RepID=UPI00141F8187|nr:tape measure domain-containing protein [Paenibacillus sp. BK720]